MPELTKEQITDMRNWIADCYWGDLDSDELDELTDQEVIKGVKRHYNGGVEQFLSDSQPE